jgi:hypothetical protein
MIMRKMLLSLTTLGVLAVPAGVAFAQTDTTEPTAPVPTCVDPIQRQDRDRSADKAALGEPIQLQTQLREHQEEQMLLRDGTCDEDGTGDQVRAHDQSQLADGTDLGAGPQSGNAAHGRGGR